MVYRIKNYERKKLDHDKVKEIVSGIEELGR